MEIENSVEYESPKFEFEKMMLTEKVAAVCWGYAYAWYDANGDGQITGAEHIDLKALGLGENGCQGSHAREALTEYFKKYFGLELTKDDVSTNVDESKSIIDVPNES